MLDTMVEKFTIQKFYTDLDTTKGYSSDTMKYFHIHKHLHVLSRKNTDTVCRCLLRLVELTKLVYKTLSVYRDICKDPNTIVAIDDLLEIQNKLTDYIEQDLIMYRVNYIPNMGDYYSIIKPSQMFMMHCNDLIFTNPRLDKELKLVYVLNNILMYVSDLQLYVLEIHNSNLVDEYAHKLADVMLLLCSDYDDSDPLSSTIYEKLKSMFFEINDDEKLVPIYEWHTILTEYKGAVRNYNELIELYSSTYG